MSVKLKKIRLRNFRCYESEISVDIDDLTLLVGKNDCGKSTILDALAIFFEEAKLDQGDATISGDQKDVSIICEFDEVPDSLIIDADYPTTLEGEYLLNGENRLEIHKVYDGSLVTPKPTGTFASALHPTADGAGDLLLLKNSDLKARATDLELDLEEIDARVNTLLRRSIWESIEDLALDIQKIPLDQEAAKKIWEQLRNYIPAFALFKSDRPSTDQDPEAQDPMKAAVSEAIKAKEAELKVITDHVEREVTEIAEETVAKLKEMDPSLAGELRPTFSKPNWKGVFKMGLTGDEDIPINKRGSGVRRLILINFFRAKAEQRATAKGSTSVIYAVEEPETSQHPANQRMLISAFRQLAETPECQVLLSTHTPVLAKLAPLDQLRYIDVAEDGRRTILEGSDETYERIAKSLGVLPENDVKLFIGVEGGNDINFLTRISSMLIQAGEDVPDLFQLEQEGEAIFFPLGGSNLALWKTRLEGLVRPEFYLFDRDTEPPAVSPHQETANEFNQRDGCLAVLTEKRETECYLHPDAIKAARPEVEVEFEDFDDVPALVARAVHDASESENAWDDLLDKKKGEKIRRAKRWLNSEAAEAMTRQMLDDRDPDGEVIGWLRQMAEMMAPA